MAGLSTFPGSAENSLKLTNLSMFWWTNFEILPDYRIVFPIMLNVILNISPIVKQNIPNCKKTNVGSSEMVVFLLLLLCSLALSTSHLSFRILTVTRQRLCPSWVSVTRVCPSVRQQRALFVWTCTCTPTCAFPVSTSSVNHAYASLPRLCSRPGHHAPSAGQSFSMSRHMKVSYTQVGIQFCDPFLCCTKFHLNECAHFQGQKCSQKKRYGYWQRGKHFGTKMSVFYSNTFFKLWQRAKKWRESSKLVYLCLLTHFTWRHHQKNVEGAILVGNFTVRLYI